MTGTFTSRPTLFLFDLCHCQCVSKIIDEDDDLFMETGTN